MTRTLSEHQNRFGKYLLLERIGVGGMAEVFKAKLFGAEGFERLVAIKRILPHLVEDDDFVKMFVDEAKIAVRLNHPGIVGIHDLGKAEGTLFIAMEFVPGKDLRAIYEAEKELEGRTPIGIATHIVMKMCEALHHAHFASGPRGEPLQVIHRDVSPQNVLVSFDGEVKVADFGLAKARGRMVQTQAGVVKGKLAYMSPEQLRGEDIDHRVDVFGLGIVLFELLSGERLFLGPSDMDTLRRVYEAKVPPMHALNPEVGPELEAIVHRALAKDRNERYQTALDLHDDLQAYVYANNCYAGTSSLRQYMRETFPDAAPLPEALPPFVSQPMSTAPPPVPPAPEPRPTHRPPALSRHEMPPPPSYEDVLAPPPLEESGVVFDEPAGLDDHEIDDRPTDIPPPGRLPDMADAGAVVARPTIKSGAPPPPEHSGTVASSERTFPSTPPGLYEDEFPTEQLPDELQATPGPDTHPAPAPASGDLPDFADEWASDEPTLYTGAAAKTPKPSEEPDTAEEDDPWDDATVVVDPRSSGSGSGRG